jgi:peptide chain release factor subunit 1
VAATVSWDGLRELAGFRAEKGCAISLYLSLDPSQAPTAGDAATRINSLLHHGEQRTESNRELSRDQREALRGDLTRIREFFQDDFDRDGARGLALFCAGLDNYWHPLPLADSVPDRVEVAREFYLSPLVPLVGRGDGALVAVVSRERGDVYRLRAGKLDEIAHQFDETPGRHDQGGWSQARFQRHIEKLAADHFRRVAELLDRQVRRLQNPRIVVVAAEENRAEFDDVLDSEVASAIVGWTSAEAHAAPAELLKAAQPILEEWHSKQEQEAADRWREESGRGARAAGGWPATLEAASDGRVELLLFQDGADRSAWQCRQCGRVSAEGGACPLDGTEMEERDDGLNLAVHQTLAHGGSVLAFRHHQDLEPVEGIGALLRY